jgi:VanZ family protein
LRAHARDDIYAVKGALARSGLVNEIVKLMRPLGVAAVVAIAMLSLVPNELRPHVGPKLLEHFIAYLGTGALLALAWPQRSLLFVMALPAYSAALEVAQIWIPGRTTSLADFTSSALGACLGVIVIWIVQRNSLLSRLKPVSRSARG